MHGKKLNVAADLELLKEAAECSDLAVRARRLLRSFADPQDRARLLAYAKELEERAATLTKRASNSD